MNKTQHIVIIQYWLDSLYPSPSPSLHYSDPFTLLVAVLLSAQCTDIRVNQVTQQLFLVASTPQAMSTTPIETIEQIIHPCGLYRTKAKALSSLSRILLEKFDGKVPKRLKDLESLPGVGHKTASVVQIQGFSIPAFPVDTHIHRLTKRWGLSSGKNVMQTEQDLKKLFPKQMWGKVHLQMILYARKHCPAKGHIEKNCPICSDLAKLRQEPAP